MQTRFTNFAEIFVPESVGMSPKRSRLAYARLVPRLITSWRAVHRPRCSRSPPPRRASRPSRPRARAPAGRARRVAGRQARREHRRRPGRDARGRRALGAVGPHRRHGRYAGIGFRSAAPSTSRAERSAERRKSVRLRPRASLARRLSLDDRLYACARASQVAKGTLGVESGRVPGSMTRHFFEDGFFFSNRFCIPRSRHARRARANDLERDDPKHNAMSLDHADRRLN